MANRSPSASQNPLFNILASVLLIVSCLCLVSVPLYIAVVPSQNPLPTEVALLVIPSPTITLTPGATNTAAPQQATFPPTWTPMTPTPLPTEPTDTPSPVPSETDLADTRTPTHTHTPTATPSKTRTPGAPTKTRAAFAYNLQAGSPSYSSNDFDPAGCNWMGIVGLVVGVSGAPQGNMTVRLEGGGLALETTTGSKPHALYGNTIYQFKLADKPAATTDTYKLQIKNSSGQILSDWVTIPTRNSCSENLIIVNFVQNH